MQVEVDGSRKDCFELVTTRDAAEIEDHKITVDGPELDEIPVGSKISLSYIVEVAGKNMQSDFESVMERKIHSFLNCIEGVMHTGQRDMIRIRVSKADFEAGFRFRHIGEVLYAKIKSEFDTVVDKCQVKIVVDEAKNKELRAMANEVFNRRDDRLRSMTDESVPVFYPCIMCQAFSPSHVCIVTPERLGLCGAVSWLDAKATNELDPQGPCQVVPKEHCIDERLGRYEDVDEAVQKYSHGALEHVTLYSLFQDPMTSCGCFECICGVEPVSMGVVITMREYAGMTPLGMTFSEMASMTGRRGRAGCGGCRRSGLCARGASVHRCRGHKRRTAAGPVLRDHRTETEAGDGHSRLCRRLGAPRHPAVPPAAGRSGLAVCPRGVCRRSVPLREERAGESVHGPAGTAARSRHPAVPRRRRNGRQRSRAAAGI